MKGQIRIEKMYAFIAVDPRDNTEGIPAFSDGKGMMLPMVGADVERVDQLRPIAEAMVASNPGMTITLCLFGDRQEVEVISNAQQRGDDA